MKEKKEYTVTAQDTRNRETTHTTSVKSYGIRWAIEDATKELSSIAPEPYLEIIRVEKVS